MYERFTDRARKVMSLANQAARRGPSRDDLPGVWEPRITLKHLLLGILEEGKGVACNVLKNLVGMDLMKLRAAVQAAIEPDPGRKTFVGLPDKLPLSPGVGAVVERSLMEADSLGNNYVGTEHLLLAMLTVCREVLVRLGIEATYDQVRDEIKTLLGRGGRARQPEGSGEVPRPGHPEEGEATSKWIDEAIAAERKRMSEETERVMAQAPRMLTRAYRQEPSFADLVARFAETRSLACPAESPEAVVAYAVDLARRVQKAIVPTASWMVEVHVPSMAAGVQDQGTPCAPPAESPADVPVVKPREGE